MTKADKADKGDVPFLSFLGTKVPDRMLPNAPNVHGV